MNWMSHHPAKRYYEYLLSMGYFDFDQILIYTKRVLFGPKPLDPLDGFIDKENHIWVLKTIENGVYSCLVGVFDTKLQLMKYFQQTLKIEEIRSRATLDGSIQLMYYKITADAIQKFMPK